MRGQKDDEFALLERSAVRIKEVVEDCPRTASWIRIQVGGDICGEMVEMARKADLNFLNSHLQVVALMRRADVPAESDVDRAGSFERKCRLKVNPLRQAT